MTTISCGGGSTLEQRRRFCSLRDGTHVPGYRGYIPRIKYRVGNTYGTDTHEIYSCEFEQKNPPPATTNFPPPPREVLRNNLPDANGDNKLTKAMVPGYTGYVPRLMYRFGGTYKEDCDHSIDEHMTFQKVHRDMQTDINRQVQSYPRLNAIAQDPEVRDKLNLYRDTHPVRPMLLDDRRPLSEAPMPGYSGYIPRVPPTDVGLGLRYNQSSQRGLDLFIREVERHHRDIYQGSKPLIPSSDGRRPLSAMSAPSGFDRRVYKVDGMIPKYTGYVPQRRFAFGNTYGDTTRTMEVCSHDQHSFGDHVRTKTRRVAFA